MAKKVFDLIKSSNFYGPSKPSFQWFATAHGESGVSESCDVKSRTNASAVPVTGGVGHDSQSVPGEIFARAHFHLIAEGQTSPRVEGEVEIM